MSADFVKLDLGFPVPGESDGKARWTPPKLKPCSAKEAEGGLGSGLDSFPNAS